MSWLDPYLYDDVDVLINKLGIKDGKILDQLERDIVTYKIAVLRQAPFKIESVFDICKIHEFLFGAIFEWAGKFRKISMYKREPILKGSSVDYTPHDYIVLEIGQLDLKFKSIDWNSLDNQAKIDKVVEVVQELWQIHCFREGNTRSTAMFLYLLLKTLKMHINVEFLGKNAIFFRNSLVLASIYSRSKPEFLRGIIVDATTVKNVDENKYQTIDGFDLSKYEYQNHTIEKLKTIKDLDDLEN